MFSYDPFIIGFVAACLSIFLNYCIGKPGGEFSPYEIFSFYTVWLSKRRLKREGLLLTYVQQYAESIQGVSGSQRKKITNEYNIILYNAAEPFFTWERAFGMCIICTGFWVSLAFGLVFTQNFLDLLIIVVISHITIRILNKII